MADTAPGRPGAASISVDADVWAEEVERFAARSRPRALADSARRKLERVGPLGQDFRRCAAVGPDGSRLGRCLKVYVPLGRPGSSEAPYGFVFEMGVDEEPPRRVRLRLLAFGERHPASGTRSVYERAHKRLHGRYPDQ